MNKKKTFTWKGESSSIFFHFYAKNQQPQLYKFYSVQNCYFNSIVTEIKCQIRRILMNGSFYECILATINEKEFDITCLVEFGYHDKSKFLTRKSIKWKIKKLFCCTFVSCVENYNNIYVFCFHEFLSNYIEHNFYIFSPF